MYEISWEKFWQNVQFIKQTLILPKKYLANEIWYVVELTFHLESTNITISTGILKSFQTIICWKLVFQVSVVNVTTVRLQMKIILNENQKFNFVSWDTATRVKAVTRAFASPPLHAHTKVAQKTVRFVPSLMIFVSFRDRSLLQSENFKDFDFFSNSKNFEA